MGKYIRFFQWGNITQKGWEIIDSIEEATEKVNKDGGYVAKLLDFELVDDDASTELKKG